MIFNFNLKGAVKIPTILGLGIILVGVGLGVFLTSQNQIFFSRAAAQSEPSNINVANISDNSASIYWETNDEVQGLIKAGSEASTLNKSYSDIRDQNTHLNYHLHFVTLTNLQPETTYYYQIQSAKSLSPKTPLSFKTSAKMETFPFEPITGNITDKNFEPVREALITLELPNAQKIAAITLVAGNFIFPLTDLKTTDLSSPFPQPTNPIKAKILVKGTNTPSEVSFNFPLQGSSLPPITLGKNTDLTIIQTSSKSAGLKIATSSAQNLSYDVNKDGVINAADISLLFKNFGKVNSNNAKLDLNSDGVINQDDVNLLVVFLK